ncbi:thioesterase II family protein [Mycobacteroides salmoniphilum]|uniref:thioesterase II family protein n=1 Tax=Mycobacteroides salmoniphilum TaxID=404941 RepID=UPI0009947AFC|nr:alpha/beta fold hydrolase [Mycobacteroides salmoniphilum]
MSQSLGWIRQFHKPETPDSPPLLVFPHAGAGASAYRALSKALSSNFDVIVFQYPGRQDRASEPALTTLQDIAAGAFDEFQTSTRNRNIPIYTFGHSMGAIVSFEFVRLAEAAGVDVRQLTVSAAVAPSRASNKPGFPEDDEELLQHLAALEGTSSDIFTNRDMLKLTLPVVKSDHRASETYSCDPGVKVAARVHVIGGDNDPIVNMRDLYDWDKHAEDLQVTLFEGGHFFINSHLAAVTELVTAGASREPRVHE